MRVGAVRERKEQEYRVALTPDGARVLVDEGHEVVIEASAGEGSGFPDEEYVAIGARIAKSAEELIGETDLVTKVKEPTPEEVAAMRPGQALFCFLHLAPEAELTRQLLERDVIAIGFETVQTDEGTLPILVPMSEVAGRLAVQVGAHYLQRDQGGSGILLGGVPGVARGHVVVLGGGVAGTAAVRIAVGLGAEVEVLDISHRRLSYLYDLFSGRIGTLHSIPSSIERAVGRADLLIGAVLLPGARAPNLVPRSLVERMRRGAVIADVSVDQGGCVETIHPTTHSDPVYEVSGVIHYGVANMPGAVPRTSTLGLTNESLPYLRELCGCGVREALRTSRALARGVNCYRGAVTHAGVAEALNISFEEAPWEP
jgi:alanine dehydrogenase